MSVTMPWYAGRAVLRPGAAPSRSPSLAGLPVQIRHGKIPIGTVKHPNVARTGRALVLRDDDGHDLHLRLEQRRHRVARVDMIDMDALAERLVRVGVPEWASEHLRIESDEVEFFWLCCNVDLDTYERLFDLDCFEPC